MSGTTKIGLGVLGCGLAMGVLGDGLLRAVPWGLNFCIWFAALVAASLALARFGRIHVTGQGRWMAGAAVLFSIGVAWRDSLAVVVLDVLAVLICVAVGIWRGRAGELRTAGVSEYLIGSAYSAALASVGPVAVAARDISWREVGRDRFPASLLAATRGLLLSVPLVVVFGALFMAADAVFQRLVLDIFGFDVGNIPQHVVLISGFAWLSSGLFWAALLAPSAPDVALPRPRALSLGIVEVGVVLGLLEVVFLAFVVVQARYMFGGGDLSATGLTYAEYARRGFFELVTVTALALPVLLLLHWTLQTRNDAEVRTFRGLSLGMVALLLVVVGLALRRMYLYVEEFGLTELRLYATVFMLWLTVTLLWFALTVLRAHRERFAFGALISGLVVVVLMNVLNPDAFIARTNLSRMHAGAEFDAYYLTLLSADATPTLTKALPNMKPKDRDLIEDDLRSRRSIPRRD